jgi:hypothetical protein
MAEMVAGPFRMPEGGPAVGLRFEYDACAVEDVKRALGLAKLMAGVRRAGGWLKESRLWFIVPAAWPTFRRLIEEMGHRVIDADPEPDPGPPPGSLEAALRQRELLKVGLRRCRLRCVSVEEVAPGDKPQRRDGVDSRPP